MLIRKCDICGREFGNGDPVYHIKRRTAKNTLPIAGLYSDYLERNEEWCEHCAAAVNNALKSMAEGESNAVK